MATRPVLSLVEQKNKPSFKSPRELKNNTQKTAFQLQQKEEVNAKRSRMESLLTQQFIGKYGSKNPKSDINDFIKRTVKQFVNSYESVLQAESMLGSLESQISDIVNNMKQAKKTKKENDALEEQINRQQTTAQAEQLKRSGSGPASRHIDENQWPVINAILALSDEQKRQQEERALHAKKLKFQQDLNKQIAENRSKAQIEAEEKSRTLEKNKKFLAQYEHEVDDMRHKKEDNFKTERTMREMQIEENKQMREREKQIRVAQEQAEMARARKLAQDEEEVKRLKKEQEKRAHDALFLENERNKELKAAQLRERQEYEIKLNKDYE